MTKVLKNNRIVHGVKKVKLYDDYLKIKGTKIKYKEIFVGRCHRHGIISFEYIKNTGYTHRYVIKGNNLVTHRILDQINEMNEIYLIDEILERV